MKKSLKRILSLLDQVGKIEGRKKFQKIVYILKQKGLSFNENYIFHYYGPYSPELQLEIDTMVESELLKEEHYNNTYHYKNTSEGKEFISDEFLANCRIEKLIDKLNSKKAYILELVATIYYLREKGYKDEKSIKKKIEIIKPKLKDHIDEAFKLYEEIENININELDN